MLSREWTWLSLVKYKRVLTWRPGDITPREYLRTRHHCTRCSKKKSTVSPNSLHRVFPSKTAFYWIQLTHRGCSLLTDSSSWVLCRSSWIFLTSGRQWAYAMSNFSTLFMPYSCKKNKQKNIMHTNYMASKNLWVLIPCFTVNRNS